MYPVVQEYTEVIIKKMKRITTIGPFQVELKESSKKDDLFDNKIILSCKPSFECKYPVWSLLLLDDQLMKITREWGLQYLISDTDKRLQQLNKNSKEVFEKVITGEYDKNIIFFNNATHQIYILSDNKFYRNLILYYIDGGINNEQYNLRAVLTHLSNSLDPNLYFKDRTIQKIPYYNVTDTCNEHIEFRYNLELDLKDLDKGRHDLNDKVKELLQLEQFKVIPKKKIKLRNDTSSY